MKAVTAPRMVHARSFPGITFGFQLTQDSPEKGIRRWRRLALGELMGKSAKSEDELPISEQSELRTGAIAGGAIGIPSNLEGQSSSCPVFDWVEDSGSAGIWGSP